LNLEALITVIMMSTSMLMVYIFLSILTIKHSSLTLTAKSMINYQLRSLMLKFLRCDSLI